MKSKDDYTETVKVLLNFGAEVNFRNARGETALHLAARNELQKVVEVLVLAGGDPLAEDNDRNKPIDLVVPEDTVSRQTLKTAMADRERIMSEAREIRAKGFTTSLQRELPLSVRSQSTLHMPLAGMQGAMMSSRYMSHTGIFQPPIGMSNMSHNQSGLMQPYGNHSGSRTSSSASSFKRQSDAVVGGPRLPQSMLNTSAGHLNVGVPPTGKPAAAMRKARSVEELDQPRARGGDGRQPHARGRKGSYHGSEVSSLWNVTPPGSVNELDVLDEEQAETKSKKSGRLRKVPKQKAPQNENDKEIEVSFSKKKAKKPQPPPQQAKPKASKYAAETQMSDGNESEEYFLDDDDDDASSVDDLDVQVRPSGRAKKHGKQLPAVPEPTSSKNDKKNKKHKRDKAPKEKAGVNTWLDEQARILKERNRVEAVSPVAHSTPPRMTKSRKGKDISSSSGSGSSDSSSSSSETSSDSDAPKGPPPPPPVKPTAKGKPKPPPPPKPSKDVRARHAPPLVQMENPGVGEMIQLDVDETQPEAQTVISIIPVNPPGPTRVEKVPHGSSSSTYVNLAKNAADSPPTPSKHKKPVPDGQKSRQPEPAGRSKDEKPIPRPRERKTTSPAKEKAQPRTTGKKVSKQQEPVVEESESSPDFSDGDDDEPVHTSAAVPTKPQVSGRPSAGKPAQHKKPGLVFEKATGDDSGQGDRSMETATVGRLRKPSDNVLTASLNTSTGSDRSAGHASFDTSSKRQKQPTEAVAQRQHPSAAQSDDEDEDSVADSDEDSESEEEEESVPTTADLKTVIYVSDGKSSMGYTLVGGNVKGVFVDTIDPESAAAGAGLTAGDHVLRVNGQLMVGKTRDEVYHTLHGFDGQLTLIVRHKPNLCRRVAESHGGAGDSFFVRAHFAVEDLRKGELNVEEGDVFDVVDTLPEGNPGYWRARKVDSATGRRTSEMGPGPFGLIPSRARADQIVVKQNLAQGKPGPNDRGGLFFRSFRRAKSATRNGSRGGEEDDDRRLSSGLDVVSYERVTRKIADARRPVVVLGLFCDTIRTMLVRDSPGLFVMPADEVETPKDEIPVDVKPILAIPPTKHCLLILSPPAIEYLQQRTDINPLTIYVSPVSKTVVKAVKAKLAPAYNKNPGYMYEEAAKFEKNYAHMFSATVPYTVDDAWFFNIKGVVDRLQNQPTWVGLSQSEIESAAAAEAKKFLPSMPVAVTSRTKRMANPAVRMSRTTDDLPDITSTQHRAETPSTVGATKLSKVAVTPSPRPVNPPTQSSEDTGARTSPAPTPVQKTVAKSRGQSTSSLDKSSTSERYQNARASPATVNLSLL